MFSNLSRNVATYQIAQTTTSQVIPLLDKGHYVKGFGIEISTRNATPTAKTFTADASTDTLTSANHLMITGLKVQVSNDGGALPSGLSALADYYVIRLTENTFKLAASLNDANSGVAIDITTDGTGTQTVTPTALAGATYKVQASIGGEHFVDLDNAANITAGTNILYQKLDPMYTHIRVVYALTDGELAIKQTTMVTGE